MACLVAMVTLVLATLTATSQQMQSDQLSAQALASSDSQLLRRLVGLMWAEQNAINSDVDDHDDIDALPFSSRPVDNVRDDGTLANDGVRLDTERPTVSRPCSRPAARRCW